jgi:hypothetical protein
MTQRGDEIELLRSLRADFPKADIATRRAAYETLQEAIAKSGTARNGRSRLRTGIGRPLIVAIVAVAIPAGFAVAAADDAVDCPDPASGTRAALEMIDQEARLWELLRCPGIENVIRIVPAGESGGVPVAPADAPAGLREQRPRDLSE